MAVTELAEIDGLTYVSLPDGLELPEQPPEIGSVAAVTLTSALYDAILLASPHCQLIDQRVQQRIRDVYALEDELYMARIGVGTALLRYAPEPDEPALLSDYQARVETARQWGREQRVALGLVLPDNLATEKSMKLARLRLQARQVIEAKWPAWAQQNCALGIYPQATADECAADIAAVIAASNATEDAVTAATTVEAVRVITATWPEI